MFLCNRQSINHNLSEEQLTLIFFVAGLFFLWIFVKVQKRKHNQDKIKEEDAEIEFIHFTPDMDVGEEQEEQEKDTE